MFVDDLELLASLYELFIDDAGVLRFEEDPEESLFYD